MTYEGPYRALCEANEYFLFFDFPPDDAPPLLRLAPSRTCLTGFMGAAVIALVLPNLAFPSSGTPSRWSTPSRRLRISRVRAERTACDSRSPRATRLT